MDFTEALSLVEKGECVGRQVWGKGRYLFMGNDNGEFNIRPTGIKVLTCRVAGADYLYLSRSTDAQVLDLQDDLFAKDWVSFGVNKEG